MQQAVDLLDQAMNPLGAADARIEQHMSFQVCQGTQHLGALDAAIGIGLGDQVEFLRPREAVVDRLGREVVVVVLVEDRRARLRLADHDLR